MSETKSPTPAVRVAGHFVDASGTKVGEFEGMIYSNGMKLDGHGKGSFEPPKPVEGESPGASQVRFIVPERFDVAVEKARVRAGVISFLAWHSEK